MHVDRHISGLRGMLAVALIGAVIVAAIAVEAALAVPQCTRYGPPTAPNVSCGYDVNQSTGVQPVFTTSSWAIRTSNTISLGRTLNWALNHRLQNGGYYNSATGWGTFASIPGSGGNYAKAECTWLNWPTTNTWNCTSYWDG